jgi:repressor LexA
MTSATEQLTVKQQKVLEFIKLRIRESLPPTIREIAAELGFSSTGTVRDYLSALVKKGYIKRPNNLSRSIELLKNNHNRIPILASIPAGKPDLAQEDIEGYLESSQIFRQEGAGGEIFALKVKGESMIDAGIIDGDIAIIRKQPFAGNGDIVAALLDNNEATLKRLRQKNNTFYLEPANKNYQPIFKNFSVIGKVISIVRKY